MSFPKQAITAHNRRAISTTQQACGLKKAANRALCARGLKMAPVRSTLLEWPIKTVCKHFRMATTHLH